MRGMASSTTFRKGARTTQPAAFAAACKIFTLVRIKMRKSMQSNQAGGGASSGTQRDALPPSAVSSAGRAAGWGRTWAAAAA